VTNVMVILAKCTSKVGWYGRTCVMFFITKMLIVFFDVDATCNV
jgi:hypothetical protein